jgi:hypothetical protein
MNNPQARAPAVDKPEKARFAGDDGAGPTLQFAPRAKMVVTDWFLDCEGCQTRLIFQK